MSASNSTTSPQAVQPATTAAITGPPIGSGISPAPASAGGLPGTGTDVNVEGGGEPGATGPPGLPDGGSSGASGS